MANDELPGIPQTPEPPELLQAADSLRHADVSSVGLTTTPTGEWALRVRVRSGARTPIHAVEDAAAGHPVVYEAEPAELPVARPAYPHLGE